MHALRTLEYKADDERVVVLRDMISRVGEEPFNSPTVFNFYLPEYQPHGGWACVVASVVVWMSWPCMCL